MPSPSTPQQIHSRIDAHVHLWRYLPAEFGWLDESRKALRRDFLPAELEAVLAAANVDAAVAVQATHTLEETRWLCACAAQSSSIAGVVGWVGLEDAGLETILDDLAALPALKGFRHIFENEAPGALTSPALARGLQSLAGRGYTFDLLVRSHQLTEATALVDQHPDLLFVLDHAAKPPLHSGDLDTWAKAVRALARRPNVCCKLSGLVTEADWHSWTVAQIHAALDVCVEAFSPARLLAASDWPVCLLATEYSKWWTLLENYAARFTGAQRDMLFGSNAARIYRLAPTASTRNS